MSSQNSGIRGKIIHSQAREIIARVIKFMKTEAENGQPSIPLANFKARVLKATGIGENTYKKIQKEAKDVETGKQRGFTSPRKNRNKKSPKSDLNVGQQEVIRSILHSYCSSEKRYPTLKGIYQKVMDSEIDFQGKLSTLSKIIKKLGFKWKKTQDKRKRLIESHDIRYKRIMYLKQLQQYIRENRPIIFTDESYINSSHCPPMTWTDDSVRCLQKPIGKGQRLIMVHAGGRDGFLPNALLIFRSGTKSGDYHDEMNHQNFMTWLKRQVIPNMPPNGVLVLDNASYHNVQVNKDPTSNTRKQDMITWLVQRNIPHDPRLTKPELYQIIKDNKSKHHKCIVDTEMEKYGFRVLRLPPYHPELNPIEKIWALVKGWVAARNTTFKLKDVEELARQKFSMVTAEEWSNVCNNVDKVVEEYMAKEHLFDEVSDSLIFTVNTGESDEELWSTDAESEEEEEIEAENTTDIPGVTPFEDLC